MCLTLAVCCIILSGVMLRVRESETAIIAGLMALTWLWTSTFGMRG